MSLQGRNFASSIVPVVILINDFDFFVLGVLPL